VKEQTFIQKISNLLSEKTYWENVISEHHAYWKSIWECLPPCEKLVNGSIMHKMHSQEEVVMIASTSLNKNACYSPEMLRYKFSKDTKHAVGQFVVLPLSLKGDTSSIS